VRPTAHVSPCTGKTRARRLSPRLKSRKRGGTRTDGRTNGWGWGWRVAEQWRASGRALPFEVVTRCRDRLATGGIRGREFALAELLWGGNRSCQAFPLPPHFAEFRTHIRERRSDRGGLINQRRSAQSAEACVYVWDITTIYNILYT